MCERFKQYCLDIQLDSIEFVYFDFMSLTGYVEMLKLSILLILTCRIMFKRLCLRSRKLVVNPFVVDSICYANIVTLLTLSLTLTYLTTKVPNFMQGTYAMVGTYTAATLYSLFSIHPYLCIPAACAIGAIVGALTYYIIIRPLIRRGASITMLMIATFAGDFILCGILFILSDILVNLGVAYYIGLVFLPARIVINGIPLVFIISTTLVAVLYVTIFLVLYKTKFGVAVRAAVENPSLAQTLGVNLEMVRLFSWILSGVLSAIAGVLWPMIPGVRISDPTYGSMQLPLIFAASIIGGVESLIGSLFGGYIVGFSQMYITLSAPQSVYGFVFPLAVMTIFLLICPRGLGELLENLVLGKKTVRRV